MKAILIARVSTEEQKEAGNSLPAQVARLERYCQSKNFTIHKTFSFDESAFGNDREVFDQILDEILLFTEKIAICCDKVDRLSRNMFDKRISDLYEKALEDKVELHFVSDGQVVNSRISAAEKFHFSISLGLAKYYSDAISDNVKRSIEGKLRKGEWIAKAPYGYKNIQRPDGSKDIVIDDTKAHIVKKAFEYYASGAYSLNLLAEKINTEFNLSWSRSFVDKLFLNPFYHGIMRVKVNGEEREYPHKYNIIITEELFNQVQQVKAGFNKKKFKYAGQPYIYRGLIRCADCGLTVTPEKHKGYVYYHCTQYNGSHGGKWIREEKLTAQLEAFFRRLELPDHVYTTVLETLRESHEHKIAFQTKRFDELTKDQKRLTTMMDKLYLDKLEGKINDETYDRFYEKFKSDSENNTRQLDQLQKADIHYYQTVKSILHFARHAHEAFLSSEVDKKRQLIKFVLQNLELKGEKLVYEPYKPFDIIIKSSDCIEWRPLVHSSRNEFIEVDHSYEHLQTTLLHLHIPVAAF